MLAAPFLYTMPSELEAFFCFAKFIEESCPLYVQPTLEGVHRGLKVSQSVPLSYDHSLYHHYKLLDRCLKIVDPELYSYLRSKNLSAEIYAFPCAYIDLELWVLLTPHSCSCPNAVRVYATARSGPAALGFFTCLWRPPQCALRNRAASPHARRSYEVFKACCYSATSWISLTKYDSPMRLLRTFPPLEALPVIGIAVTLVRDVPADLYDELVRHPYAVLEQH